MVITIALEGENYLRTNRKYLVAVALLAVLAVVFGLAGTVAPVSEFVSPQQSSSSSDSVTHFMNPPTYDSGWVGITGKAGQYFTIVHNLGTMNVTVDITGRTTMDGGDHQRNLCGTGYTPGWSRTYEREGQERAYSVVQTSDGGYALAGFARPSLFDLVDFWLVKTDSNGYMVWNKTYGGAYSDYAYSVVQTSDGGYALAGYTALPDGPYGSYDFRLVKTDSAGTMQWNRTYGRAEWEGAQSVVQTSDGGYALAGYTGPAFGPYDFWLVKTDPTGNALWNRTYGRAEWEGAQSVVQTSDGGYALAGYTGPSGGPYDFWLVKTDSNGYMVWNQTYGGAYDDAAESMVQTFDGGYALAGYTEAEFGFYDFLLVKTDATGNLQWSQTYGGTDDDYAYSVVQTSDGGYAMAGCRGALAVMGDVWLVKTGVESGLVWTDSTADTITLYRGKTDAYWNYVRVRIWLIKEPTWQYGDINGDGVVDVQDLYILGQNYGKTFSLLSLSGIVAIAGIHQYKKRKQSK